MISLRDSIEIRTSPNQVFTWLESMPQEYEDWHPDHVACRVIQGAMLEVGSVIECEEYLHGKFHSMRFRMTKVVPSRRIEFVIEKMGRGAFEVQAMDELVLFVAELEIGSETPIIGSVIDLIFSIFFKQRIDAMRQHMKEEGENLKAILESEISEQFS
ncbi:MAG: hypothetical protein GTO14_25025 [Anaerolineales bacterium]|nr:hypothetical protein [Anaerolineales bacterium]